MTVTLIRIAGDDLDVVNGARISLNVEHDTLTDADRGLIARLVRDGHSEPVRGVWAKFKVVCSIKAARQQMTHKRYIAITEVSTRYTQVDDVFVTPDLKRQVGKAMDYQYEPLHDDVKRLAVEQMQAKAQECFALYQQMLHAGVSKEDAAYILPMGTRTGLIMSGDLAGWLRYLSRRTHRTSQQESREIAHAIEAILREHVPVTLAAWDSTGRRPL
jgi:thymidylate synthase (FAD)